MYVGLATETSRTATVISVNSFSFQKRVHQSSVSARNLKRTHINNSTCLLMALMTIPVSVPVLVLMKGSGYMMDMEEDV